MRSEIVQRLAKNFEDYVHEKDGVEFWFARDLQVLLGYTQWRNFLNVVEKLRNRVKIQTTRFQIILLASANR